MSDLLSSFAIVIKNWTILFHLIGNFRISLSWIFMIHLDFNESKHLLKVSRVAHLICNNNWNPTNQNAFVHLTVFFIHFSIIFLQTNFTFYFYPYCDTDTKLHVSSALCFINKYYKSIHSYCSNWWSH